VEECSNENGAMNKITCFPVLGFNEIPVWIIVLVTLGLMIATALATYFGVVPRFRKQAGLVCSVLC